MSEKAELERMLSQARAANDRESADLFEKEINRLGTAEAETANTSEGAIGAEEASDTDKFVGHGATRAALGAANLVLGPLQLGANIGDKITEMTGGRPVVGKWMNEKMQQLEAMKNRGMKAHGNEGFDWAGLAGNVAGALPMALTRTAAKTTGEKIAQGAGVGAAMGAGAPVVDEDYWAKKKAQITTDAAIGAVIPGGAELVKAGGKAGANFLKAAAEPITKDGRQAIEGRFLDMVIPQDASTREKVLQALMNPQKQLVAGSQPTAGELVSNIPEAAALAAHQKQLSRDSGIRKGESPISSDFAARYAAQDKAQVGAIDTLAGTPQQLTQAVEERSRNAAQLYKPVSDSTAKVDASSVTKEIQEIIAKHPEERKITNPLTDILERLDGADVSPRRMASLSKDIKAMIAKTSDNKPEFDAMALTKIKTLLDEVIGTAEPAYKAAKEQYKVDSLPVNKAQTGQVLKDKLVNALGQKTPSTFADAASNPQKTIKEATGFGKLNSYDDIFGGDAQVAKDVLSDLKRKQAYDDLADQANSPVSGGIHATVKGAEGTPGIPRLLSTPATITNYAMKMAGQSADGQINKSIADKYLNPEKLAALLDGKGPKKMTKVQAEQRSAIIKALLGRDWGNTNAAVASIIANQENK